MVDFKRRKFDAPAKVERLEYDPNRTAFIALIKYEDGELAYILAPQRLAVGDTVVAGRACRREARQCHADGATFRSAPSCTISSSRSARAARSRARPAPMRRSSAATRTTSILRLNSGEQRLVLGSCMATVGAVSNPDHMNTSIGKAGRKRWLGRRPHNRGVSMNPIDHPHGGGEGRTSGGRHPVTPWGKPPRARRPARTSRRRNSSCRAATREEEVRTKHHDAFGLEGSVRRRLSAEEGGGRARRRAATR